MKRFEIERVICELKPICDVLMNNPSVENARKITDCVNDISDVVLQDLSFYILAPIINHLENDKLNKDVKEELVIALNAVISKVRITKLALFNRLYLCLLMQIYDQNQSSMVIPFHEELKEAVLLCVKNLLNRCCLDVIESLYVRENTPKLAKGIYLCVSIAKTEKSLSLRLVALETIMSLCQIDKNIDNTDIILQNQIADVIMLILPGIAGGLLDVALRTDIQSHKIIVMAIRAWGRVISLVMQDTGTDEFSDVSAIDIFMKNNSNVSNDPLGTSLRGKSPDVMKTYINTVKRNAEWLDAASEKLNVLVQELAALQSHSHWKVRKELAVTIRLLLKTSSKNLKKNVKELLQYLISLSEDDVKEVREEAQCTLQEINLHYTQNQIMRPLIELLEESFYELITTLPGIIRRSESNEQLSYLHRLAGYLQLLKQRLPFLMASTPHGRKLIISLLYIIELDCSDISLLEDLSIKGFDETSCFHRSVSWKRFKFIQDSACVDKVIASCNMLGQYGELQILADIILSLISDMPQYKKELILLLNWIVCEPPKDLILPNVYKDIIDCYINPELWYPPIEVTETVPLCTAQSNMVQCCLLCESLGSIAMKLKQRYDQFLLATLYLVIERAGCGYEPLSSISVQTLKNIASSQGHQSIEDLLRANVDYFSYQVTVKLRRVERHPGVLNVIGVVMTYSTIDLLPCLKEIVQDILLQLNSNFQKRNLYSFLRVFYTFIICIKKLIERNSNEVIIKEQNTVDDEHNPHDKVINSLLEYYQAKKIDEKIDENVDDTTIDVLPDGQKDGEGIDENSTYTEEEEESSNVPNYVTMVEDIMKHCLHFVPSKEPSKSLIVMSMLEEAVVILSKWENRLLPIVHQIWHPLVEKFQETNVLVVNRAWQLLRILANVSKDFIRSRTLSQVWPALSKILQDSAAKSYNKDTGNVYKFTQMYKLQKELLSGLAEIATDLKLQERELWKVLSITEPYLSAQQNPVLQNCCVSLYKSIADYNSDIVLIKCFSIWHSKVAPIVCDKTFDIQQLEIGKDRLPNEYYRNLETIITYVEKKNDFG